MNKLSRELIPPTGVSREDASDGFSDIPTNPSDPRQVVRIDTARGPKRQTTVSALGVTAKQGREVTIGVNVDDEGVETLEVVPTATERALEATTPIAKLAQAPFQVQADVAALRRNEPTTHRADLVNEDHAKLAQRPKKNTAETQRTLNKSDVPWD